MSERRLRPSTTKQTVKQKEDSEKLGARKRTDTSLKLREICRQEEKLYLDSTLELVEYTKEVVAKRPKDKEATDIIVLESSLSEEFFDINNTAQESDDEWDPLGVVRTPRKDSSVPLVLGTGEPDTWSTTVNQFFPLNCTSTPISKLQRRTSVLSSSSDILSPRICLAEIPEESENLSDFIVNIGNVFDEEIISQSLQLPKIPPDMAMDEDTFKTRLVALKKEIVKVHLRIDEFGPESVNLTDKETFKPDLDEVRKVFRRARDKLYEFITDLDEDVDAARIVQLKSIDKSMSDKFKTNEIAVKEKMAELITAAEAKASTDLENQKEKKGSEEKRAKFEVRMRNHLTKTKDLKQSVLRLKDCTDMSEQEIRKHLLESKDWEKKVEKLTTCKETVEEEILSLDVDQDLQQEFETEFDELVDCVKKKIDELALEDAALGLHTLSPNKVKENVVYPKPFNGHDGEDVYKFMREIKEAIAADHVRTNDEVKTLRKYLASKAKLAVGEHHKTLKDALEYLVSAYGQPMRIWQVLQTEIQGKLHARAWGKTFSKERLDAINQLLDFIRHAETLAEEHEDLHGEVFSASTITMIKKILPFDYLKEVNLHVPMSFSKPSKLERIQNILEMQKEAVINGIDVDSTSKKENGDKAHFGNKPRGKGGRYGDRKSKHSCSTSTMCKEEWDKLGCIELYKLATVEEREKMLRSLSHCIKCGAAWIPAPKTDPSKFHKCKWPTEKAGARCQGDGSNPCFRGAALCLDHPNNASGELRSWLARFSIKFKVGVVNLNFSSLGNHGEIDEFIKFLENKKGTEGDLEQHWNSFKANRNPITKTFDRDELQTGQSSVMMSDDEIHKYFSEDMRIRGDTSPIHPIPKGDPVFIFCIFQGKKGPIQTLIDSGANCWLSVDMIPQLELESMKMMDGPIPIGVASGMTVSANAEWASMLPLSDGSNQCVRGLTMDKVTGSMDKLNLVPIFDQIKKDNKAVDSIQNLKIPEIVGGEVQMILGIKYQNIYPTPLHTFPNGLTVFESKLKPTKPGMLACIGGPVEALEHLCGITGAKSTIGYMSHLVQNMKTNVPKLEYFPSYKQNHLMDFNIPGLEQMLDNEDNDAIFEELETDEDQTEESGDKNKVPFDDFFDTNIMTSNPQDEIITLSESDDSLEENKTPDGVKPKEEAETTSSNDENPETEKNEDVQDIDDFIKELKSSRVNDDSFLDIDELGKLLKEYRNKLPNKMKNELEKFKQDLNDWELNKKHIDANEKEADETVNLSMNKLSPGKVSPFCLGCDHGRSHLVQSEFEKYMKLQDAGLDMNYKCPKCRNCRDCLTGPGKERISLLQESEQQRIRESVRIDKELRRAIAHLAFTKDPTEHLKDNSRIAKKRLENICRKYGVNTEVSTMIMKGFQKLIDRKHIIPWDDLTEKQKASIETAPSTYTIPWDVGFKETSVSTPARPTFDASSRSPGGTSLNEILAKGNADLVDLVHMVFNWLIGPSAICGDISQFYNTVLLEEDHWQYQKVLWYANMDISSRLMTGIIRTAIYGVRCVGAQTEEIMRMVAEDVKETFPEVWKLLVKLRYVDDFGQSSINNDESLKLIQNTEKVLHETVQMEVKGWAVSGTPPPKQISEDGLSVGFAGMEWNPLIDIYNLNIDSLHFGKKKRGRYPPGLKKFSGTFGVTMEEFTPKKLTRRMCTSVAARLYDIPQKLAPLHLRLKYDLRKLIKEDPAWDSPISEPLRSRWCENFRMIEDLRDVLYVRCHISADALRPTVRILLLGDAADGGMIISAYSGNEKPDGSWTCGHLFAKNLLAPENWTTPKLELHALSTMANMAAILLDTLGEWVEILIAASDSEIALAWTIYEKCKLHVFHRMRVSNIRNKIDLENLYHVDGKENIADLGTRPDLLTVEQMSAGSEWLTGKKWMKGPIQSAVDDGILKNTKDIILDNDKKKIFKEAIIFDPFDDDKIAENVAHKVDANKVVEREKSSIYIYPPLKRSFRPTVRIIAMVLTAVAKFKKLRLLAKARKGENVKSDLENLNFPPVKFTAFPLVIGTNVQPSLEDIFDANEDRNEVKRVKLTDIFGLGVKLKKNPNKIVKITDEALSAALDYLYKKATLEVVQNHDKKFLAKIGTMVDGILYSKSRILEGQTLRAVGELENSIDLNSFTGINFKVPIIDRHSPLAISIANHLHYNVIKHKGAETIYRMSLQYAKIIQGRVLLKDVSDDCVYCKKLRLKYIKMIMGPLSESQLSISPIFFYTYVDAWGPIKAYTPGYKKDTRAGEKSFNLYMVVFGCAATATINIQMMEGGKDTGCVLDVFNRFFAEACVPKICFPDKDGALMKALSEGEVDLVSLEGVLSSQRGIYFRTCSAQDHSAHGRIEARIKMIQQSLDRSSIKNEKLHSLGWQTVAKLLEREVNSIPLGYLHHETDQATLLRVLTPNSLKLNTSSDRAPVSIFSVPERVSDMITEVEDTYKAWYRVWNECYVPLIAERQKWHIDSPNLKENDIIYFKLKDSKLGQKWLIGKVEFVTLSKDSKVRTVGVSYKHDTEDGERKLSVVERPVRECIKLFNIEDTSLLDDIRAVQKAATEILDEDKIVPQATLDKIFDDDSTTPENDINDPTEDVLNEDHQIETDDEEIPPPPQETEVKKKKKTEIEKLKIENWKPPKNAKRISPKPSNNFSNSLSYSPITGIDAAEIFALQTTSIYIDNSADTARDEFIRDKGQQDWDSEGVFSGLEYGEEMIMENNPLILI